MMSGTDVSKIWWKYVICLLIGALAPSLIAWGAMGTKIEHNTQELNKRLPITTFVEYKEGVKETLGQMQVTLSRIEGKLDTR